MKVNEKSLIAHDQWLRRASQGHEMYCHDMEVMSSDSSWIELRVRSRLLLSKSILSSHSGNNQRVGSSAPVVSRCFLGGYNVKLYISRGRLAWWLLAFLCCVSSMLKITVASHFGEQKAIEAELVLVDCGATSEHFMNHKRPVGLSLVLVGL